MTLQNVKVFSTIFMGLLLAAVVFAPAAHAAETVSLGSLDLGKVQQGWGQPHADKSVDDNPLSIGGKKFEHGLGTHAISTLYINLKGGAERFTAFVGVDDETEPNQGSVVFRVSGDGRELWKSKTMETGQTPEKVDLNLKGIKILLLSVGNAGDGIDYDHADWADAKIEFTGAAPKTIAAPPGSAETSKPAEAPNRRPSAKYRSFSPPNPGPPRA